MRMSTVRKALTRVGGTVVLSGTLVVGSLGPVQAGYGDPVPNTYILINNSSWKCLDVAYGGVANFSPVVQYACHGQPIPWWVVLPTGAPYTYTLRNVNSGKCLDVVYGGGDDFAPVTQFTCNGGRSQQWVITDLHLSGSYSYSIRNVNSGKCLDIAYGGPDDFLPAVQFRCYGGPIQQWQLPQVRQ